MGLLDREHRFLTEDEVMKWLLKGLLILGGLACCLVGAAGTYLLIVNALYGSYNPDTDYHKLRTMILPFVPSSLLLPAGLFLIWATLRYGHKVN